MTQSEASGGQRGHWDQVYAGAPEFFGEAPSAPAVAAAEVFSREGVQHVLELGFGQGRDTVLFAQRGMRVTGFDYAPRAVEEVREACRDRGLGERVSVAEWDLRRPLPLPDASVDACYSHMLLCMEFSEREIAAILREIHRVLRPGGVAFYTVRSTYDKHYRAGVPRGGDLYDVGGFVVHFFSEAKIRRLARGFEALGVERVEEGRLPRDLFQVTLRKIDGFPFESAAGAAGEGMMGTAMDAFQAFFDATYGDGVIDRKTKHLLALSASLAAGCES